MLYRTQTVFMSRCPLCGALEEHQLSLFDLSGQRELKVTCSCGFFIKLRIFTVGIREYVVELPCALCEVDHDFNFDHEKLWHGHPLEVFCPEFEVIIGVFGVGGQLGRSLFGKPDDAGLVGVERPPIEAYSGDLLAAERVLNRIQYLDRNNLIYCQCGNYGIQIGVYTQRIDLHCPRCGSVTEIFIEDEDAYQYLEEHELIEMMESGYTVIRSQNRETP